MPAQALKKKPQTDSGDRRKQILRAAVSVFAERGFHKTRVSDIARRAGVAYGLVYHYFESKEAVLGSVFEDNWAVFLKVLRDLAQDPARSTREKIGGISDLLIGALRLEPALIQVIIQEVARAGRTVLPSKVAAFEEALEIVRGILREGQRRGEVPEEIDPQAAAYALFGGLEAICTGFTFGKIACGTDAEAERLKRSVRRILLDGMVEP